MPCNSDYMNPSSLEINMSRVLCIMDELKGKAIDDNRWRGYHPLAYGRDICKDDLDKAVAKVCKRLSKMKEEQIKQCSLELQMWWRDHKKADAKRLAAEEEAATLKQKREAVLARLTPEERKLLGF